VWVEMWEFRLDGFNGGHKDVMNVCLAAASSKLPNITVNSFRPQDTYTRYKSTDFEDKKYAEQNILATVCECDMTVKYKYVPMLLMLHQSFLCV